MKIKLSPRLQRIADYVLPGSTVIDVGTDHAYIPIWLLQNGISASAYATDIRTGPLQRAAKDAEDAGVSNRLTLLLCDGLSECPPDAVDTVIIAGMGGETMMGILSAAPWVLQKHLILQPQTKYFELRAFLAENGYAIRDASLVYDTGRIYRVWQIEAGENTEKGWVEAPLVEKKDPLLRPYLEDMVKRLRKQIQGQERAVNSDAALLSALHGELDEYLQLLEEAKTWQQ